MSSAPMKGYVLEVFHDDKSTGPGGSAWVLAFATEAERDEAAEMLQVSTLRGTADALRGLNELIAKEFAPIRTRLAEAERLLGRALYLVSELAEEWHPDTDEHDDARQFGEAARRFLQGESKDD